MLITCPSCASDYHIPADRIGASGRKVRCASCRDSWFVASPEETTDFEPRPSLESEMQAADVEIVARPVPPPPPMNVREPLQRPGDPRGRDPKERTGRAARAMRIAAAAAVCLALPALLVLREAVVSAAPGTASLYRAIGLPVNLVGLRFAEVRSTLSLDAATPVLEVTGEIVNDGRVARTVPWLQISLEGEGGEALYSWSAKPAEGELGVGQTAPFRVRLTAPPPAARKVEVTFRRDKGRRSVAWN